MCDHSNSNCSDQYFYICFTTRAGGQIVVCDEDDAIAIAREIPLRAVKHTKAPCLCLWELACKNSSLIQEGSLNQITVTSPKDDAEGEALQKSVDNHVAFILTPESYVELDGEEGHVIHRISQMAEPSVVEKAGDKL